MLTVEGSRRRQRRLLEVLQRRKLDAVVLGATPHVYYCSAQLPFWLHQAGFVLFADGRSLLVWPNAVPSTPAAADNVVTYEANWYSTLRQEQPMAIADAIADALTRRGVGSVGVDGSAVSTHLAMELNGSCEMIEPELWQLRRRKDEDELRLMRQAIRCCEAMYARARQVIEPGVPELKVFAELHTAAIEAAGEPLTALLGNDYACGEKGGPARGGRLAQAGELYILDLGPAYRGYFSDNARTFAVDRKPTDEQLGACEAIKGALAVVERLATPGVRCREIFDAVDEHLKSRGTPGLTHHLGHGVGLQPHEYPHLNPKWDDTLIEGEVFTAEPGVYAPDLRAGIRLENQYLVTATGVENLLDFPLDLA